MKQPPATNTQIPTFSVGGACLGFKLTRTYISDNLLLYAAPNIPFCLACFHRRYLTQMMQAVQTHKLSPACLELAQSLDQSLTDDQLWHVYSIEKRQAIISFELVPYEDCPACSTAPTAIPKSQAALEYAQNLTGKPQADYAGMRGRIFSFGFARQLQVSRNVGLADKSYDQLMADKFASRTYSRLIDPAGNHLDISTLGVAAEQDIAEIKSIMEYLERYAFLLKVCRLPTTEFDQPLINKFLSLYCEPVSDSELVNIQAQAVWALNLLNQEVVPIPLAFIYSSPGMRFIKPTSSGFGAHGDFRQSLCRSILELIERDAFVRFWHEPARAYNFPPPAQIQASIDDALTILARALGHGPLTSRCYVLQSATQIPVVMITASSADTSKPPSLCFGCGAGFDLQQAIEGALTEFRFNLINLVKGVSLIDGFTTKNFSGKIEELQDRFNYYATAHPRPKLKFLDTDNPLPESIYADAPNATLESLVDRFKHADLDIYAIDCTPACFKKFSVHVTRAFSTGMYPMQFQQEDYFNLTAGPLSAHKMLPHFFL